MRKGATAFLLGAILVSCDGPDAPEFLPRLEADITGHIVVHYVGDATFHTAVHARGDLPLFELVSENFPHPPGLPTEGYESVVFEGWRRLPKRGVHNVSDRRSAFADTSLTNIGYMRAIDGNIEWYSAVSGTYDISYSSDERLEGTFAIEAVLFCRQSQDPDVPITERCDPMTLDLSRPRISVVGSFVGQRGPEEYGVINQPGGHGT